MLLKEPLAKRVVWGLVAQPRICLWQFTSWIGPGPREELWWSEGILLGQCRFRFGQVRGGFFTGKTAPPVGYTRGKLNTAIMVAVLSPLTLKLYH